jgi:type II secretion system protein H
MIRVSYFSLIEIVVVILIIGVMMSFAVLSYDNDLPETRLKSVARSISSLLQTAHSRAKSQGVPIVLEIDREKGKISLSPWEGRLAEIKCPKEITIGDIRTMGGEEDEEIIEYTFKPNSINSSLIIELTNREEKMVSVIYNALMGTASLKDGLFEEQWVEEIARF